MIKRQGTYPYSLSLDSVYVFGPSALCAPNTTQGNAKLGQHARDVLTPPRAQSISLFSVLIRFLPLCIGLLGTVEVCEANNLEVVESK